MRVAILDREAQVKYFVEAHLKNKHQFFKKYLESMFAYTYCWSKFSGCKSEKGSETNMY